MQISCFFLLNETVQALVPSKHCNNANLRLAHIYHCMTCRTYKNPSQGERKNALQEVPPQVAAAVKGSWRYQQGLAGPQAKSQNHTRSVTLRPKFTAWLVGPAIMKLNIGLDLTLSNGAKPQCYVGNIPVALMGKLFLWSPPSGSEELLKPLALYTMNKSAIRCRTNTERQTTICSHVHKRL